VRLELVVKVVTGPGATDTARNRVDARCPSTAGLRANAARTQVRLATVRHKPQTIALIVLIPDAHENRNAIEIPNCLKQLGLYLTLEQSAQPNSHTSHCTIPLQQLRLYLTQEYSIQPVPDTFVFHPLTASGLTPDDRISALEGVVLNNDRLWYYA
jgi:hypothetical protein